MNLCGISLHLRYTEQHTIDRGYPVVDHAAGQVPPIGEAGEHEALTGDDRVDERQHRVEDLIMRGQTVHARSASRAGQVRIEAQPAVPLREEGFHEPFHDAVIAWPSRQHHDGPTSAIGFIEDRDISEVTFHLLIPPFMRLSIRSGRSASVLDKLQCSTEQETILLLSTSFCMGLP